MILASSIGLPVENPLVIGIGIAYLLFIVGYIWWNDRKEK